MPVIQDHEDKFYNNRRDIGTKYVEVTTRIGKLGMPEYMFMAFEAAEVQWEREFEEDDDYLWGSDDRTSVIVTYGRDEQGYRCLTLVVFMRASGHPSQTPEEIRNPTSTP